MCKPTKISSNTEDASSDSTAVPKNGFLYGTISLAMSVSAGALTMGHFNSHRDSLGCDAMCVGSFQSSRSMLTLIGSTIVGKLSDSPSLDKFGGARRLCLIIGILASIFEATMAVKASSITGLWISMVPAALLNQNFNGLKALFGEYHGESASAAERAGTVGRLGMAVGLAFMVGPLLSSTFLQTYDHAVTVAVLLQVLALLFVFLLPRPTRSLSKTSKENEESKPKSLLGKLIPDLVPAARTPAAMFVMACRVCMALAFHVFQTIWTVALKERFHFGPKDYGRYFGFIGFAFALSQGFVAKFLLASFAKTNVGRTRLLLVCALILGGGRMLVYQTNEIKVVYALFTVIVIALGVINTVFTADTSKLAPPSELGGLFGVLASMESVAGIAGPVLGGALAKVHPTQGPLLAVIVLYGLVFSMVYVGYERLVLTGTGKKEKEI